MDILKSILGILKANITIVECIEQLGPVRKTIGNNIIIDPIAHDIQGISLIRDNQNRVLKICIIFNTEILYSELIKLASPSLFAFNNYDGKSAVILRINDRVELRAFVTGYVSENELMHQGFKEFEIVLK